MFYLLNPRVWIALALVAAFAACNIWSYRHGKQIVLAEWNQAKAAATADARRVEQERQSNVDKALRDAAAREARARADSASARRASLGLRDDLRALGLRSEKSLASALDANRALSNVVEQCSAALVEVAEDADRSRDESLTLRMAWPR